MFPSRDVEEEEVALVSKMLPRWKKRHEEDCRRCVNAHVRRLARPVPVKKTYTHTHKLRSVLRFYFTRYE